MVSHAAANDEDVQIVKKSKTLTEDTSEANRLNKSYILAAQVAGFTVAPIPGFGAIAGYYFNRNSLIQIEYTTGTLPYLFFDFQADTAEINYKHFFGNSFYAKGGLAYRKLVLKNVRFLFSDETTGEIGTVESLAAGLAIGNQWQWKEFTLGCDWIGYMAPFSTIRKDYDNAGATGQDAKDLDDAWQKLADVGSLQFLRLYLGFSF